MVGYIAHASADRDPSIAVPQSRDAEYAQIMETTGKVLLIGAVVLALLGLGALLLARLGVDRLPGTLTWRSGRTTVSVPLGLMVLVSVVGTILLNVFLRR
jgi:hypothetical protein